MVSRKSAKNFHNDIVSLISQGMTNPEISDEIGLSRAQVACYVQKNLGGNPNYLKRKTKHKHLHKKILEMRLALSDSEIRKKLGLTKAEMKSCMTLAYRDKSLKHLRKDTRRRDSWTNDELRFLLRWSGIISQDEINHHLKRGNSRIVIKEKMQKLGLASKNVNGLTLSKFTKLFGKMPKYILCTSAGSPASSFSSEANWKIVPWMHINEMLASNYITHTAAVEKYVSSMALFQEWVHGKDYWKSLTEKPKF